MQADPAAQDLILQVDEVSFGTFCTCHTSEALLATWSHVGLWMFSAGHVTAALFLFLLVTLKLLSGMKGILLVFLVCAVLSH